MNALDSDRMNKERSRRGAIGFNVRMVARVKFKAGAWRARRRFVRVYCKDLSVGLGQIIHRVPYLVVHDSAGLDSYGNRQLRADMPVSLHIWTYSPQTSKTVTNLKV
ncbi:hypothetical protein MTR67_030332 [Solanum verrucosum]|uniref:Uncharacterized protein n=1 Tax=Solanum verrucosum TaxID=315347 RepID=A0AAF0RAT7_SOLVR|nr:hypothetical protein MTR67_030332 [Solanum verrucosum]